MFSAVHTLQLGRALIVGGGGEGSNLFSRGSFPILGIRINCSLWLVVGFVSVCGWMKKLFIHLSGLISRSRLLFGQCLTREYFVRTRVDNSYRVRYASIWRPAHFLHFNHSTKPQWTEKKQNIAIRMRFVWTIYSQKSSALTLQVLRLFLHSYYPIVRAAFCFVVPWQFNQIL